MSGTAAWMAWGALGVLTALLWVRSRVGGARFFEVDRPSEIGARLATGSVLRVLLAAGWMWLGWHLFAR